MDQFLTTRSAPRWALHSIAKGTTHMPIFHVRVSYSTHGDDPADALATFFAAVAQPGSMVAEIFADDSRPHAIAEFDGDSLVEIARKART